METYTSLLLNISILITKLKKDIWVYKQKNAKEREIMRGLKLSDHNIELEE